MIDIGVVAICYRTSSYQALDGYRAETVWCDVTLAGARLGECVRDAEGIWHFTETASEEMMPFGSTYQVCQNALAWDKQSVEEEYPDEEDQNAELENEPLP